MSAQALTTALDNPIWNALTSLQSDLAEGDALARRFPTDIGPLAGLVSQSEEAYVSLAKLAKPDEQLVLFLETQPVLPAGWQLDVQGPLLQMVLEKSLPKSDTAHIEVLTEADVPEMIALTQLTNPGPFRQRTIQLGTYLGIRESGHLVAMAGERLHMPGYTEVSAVCTHPDFQGKGYARTLIMAVANNIINSGETPMLHSWLHNENAIRVYEKIGFTRRRQLDLAVLTYSK